MRCAVIDLGTNTFNLIIGEKRSNSWSIIHSEKDGVAIGMGGINKNIISKDSWLRALNTLNHFREVCEEYEVDKIQAIGTSALRGAANGIEFADFVYDNLGIPVRIISGEEEAQFIYRGVNWTHVFDEPSVIMDIGGGSTEFIWAHKDGVQEVLSLNIGVSRIYQGLDLGDPFTPEDIQKVLTWLEMHSKGSLDNKMAKTLIGASGSFETFYELINNIPFTLDNKSIALDKKRLDDIIQWLIYSSFIERDQNDLIIPIRKKMAPIAALKAMWVMEKLGVQEVVFSPNSLKEGVLLSHF